MIISVLRLSGSYDEGEFVPAASMVITVCGNARKILQSERLVLNFMARMSGISTLTRECVLCAGGRARIAATRKTTPGFRLFEKKAVFLGGGDTHRFNLSDAVLIKDNHIKILGLEECLLPGPESGQLHQEDRGGGGKPGRYAYSRERAAQISSCSTTWTRQRLLQE